MKFMKTKYFLIALLIPLLCLSMVSVNAKAEETNPEAWWNPADTGENNRPRSSNKDDTSFDRYLNGAAIDDNVDKTLQDAKKKDDHYGAYKDENGIYHYYMAFSWSDARRKRGATSWQNAEDECESMNGHLATVTSEKEQDYLFDHYLSRGYRFIGLKKNIGLKRNDAIKNSSDEEW